MPDAREEGNNFKILPPLGGSSDDDTIAYTHEVILGTLGALLHAVVIIADVFSHTLVPADAGRFVCRFLSSQRLDAAGYGSVFLTPCLHMFTLAFGTASAFISLFCF